MRNQTEDSEKIYGEKEKKNKTVLMVRNKILNKMIIRVIMV